MDGGTCKNEGSFIMAIHGYGGNSFHTPDLKREAGTIDTIEFVPQYIVVVGEQW